MNDTGVTRESEFILRRLGEAFPLSPANLSESFLSWCSTQVGVDLSGLAWLFQIGLYCLLVAGGLGLIWRWYRNEHQEHPHWAWPLTVIRLVALLLIFLAVAFPRIRLDTITLRLSDAPVEIGPIEHASWLLFLAGILTAAFAFVVGGYLRDSRSIRWYWAVPLATARLLVYLLLVAAFLLPAMQTWEKLEKRSRVIVLLDVSPSITAVSDDVHRNSSTPAKTRMTKLLEYLAAPDNPLLTGLLEKNPVVVYRFGARLDDESQTIQRGQPLWSIEEWQSWVNYDFKPGLLRGLSPAAQQAIQATAAWNAGSPGNADWALAWAKLPAEETIPSSLEPADQELLLQRRSRLEQRIDLARAIVLGTSIADSVKSVIDREAANMVQGIVVFSDGRNNLGSPTALSELQERAEREKIPIFTVALGHARENIGIQITDLQAPDRAPPDEQFKIAVEADGIGLLGQEVEVRLALYLPGRNPKTDAPDHELIEKLTFQPGEPPHGQAEFVIDPEKLPELLTEPSSKIGRNRQLKSGAWSAVARIARDRREVFPDPDHVSPARVFQVLDKPLRVLLFSSGPSREYQTLRTLFIRESQSNRAELSICLQNEAGKDGTAVQDVPPERLLNRFPTRLDTTSKPTDKPEDKYYNLNEYDLIIAFDPDWSELSAEQIQNLQTWVDNLGGGFLYVAGPLHTFQLARAAEDGRMKPLLDILPVIPDDIILLKTRPVPRIPRRLLLKPNPDFDVLNLTDDNRDDPTAGWEQFFTRRDRLPPGSDPRTLLTPSRGIYAYYPIKATKPGSITLAEFLDVTDRGEPDPKPWLVTTQPVRGRTAFIGSGELYRLRSCNFDYYDRFWIKLARYLSANRDVKAARGRILIAKEVISGAPLRVQARLLNPSGRPYGENELTPKFRVVAYTGNGEPLNKQFGPYELKAKKSATGFDGYYSGQITVDPRLMPPGDFRYRVMIDVPDSPGDTLESEFLVKQSDPELDETRPDFAYLQALASPVRAVESRISNPDTLAALRGVATDSGQAKLSFREADRERLKLIPECLEAKYQNTRNRGPVEDLWDKPLPLAFLGIDGYLVDTHLTPTRAFAGSVLVTVLALGLLLYVAITVWQGRAELNLATVPLILFVIAIAVVGGIGIALSRLYDFDYHVQIGGLLLLVTALLCFEWTIRKFLRIA
jgi:hypothetical protein